MGMERGTRWTSSSARLASTSLQASVSIIWDKRSEVWKDRASAYQRMFVPVFPNYLGMIPHLSFSALRPNEIVRFIVMGPGSPSAHGLTALIPSTEHVSDYTIKVNLIMCPIMAVVAVLCAPEE
ncbi:hypothetical protein BT69DRAFT_1344888 [Atractiella rhizophila]|nr:hypothetical protein BT69DRAFT_1344888 [Atractiella rhizophila]